MSIQPAWQKTLVYFSALASETIKGGPVKQPARLFFQPLRGSRRLSTSSLIRSPADRSSAASPTPTAASPTPTAASPADSQSRNSFLSLENSHSLSALIETIVETPIRPLSINELLALQTVGAPGDDRPHSECSSPRQSRGALLIRTANWARKEISIRLAHRLYDFNRLPFLVVADPHVFEVYQLYCQAFTCFMNFGEVRTRQDEERFSQQLQAIVAQHANVVALMQVGMARLKQQHLKTDHFSLDSFLDRLFGTRIGNRVLAESHLALHDKPEWFASAGGAKATSSVIQRQCCPAKILRDVAEKAQQVAAHSYGRSPEVVVGGELDLVFPYIPEHLRFICFEILKNSIRATVEFHKEQHLPPVHVGVHRGHSHVLIKVIDEGGGLRADLHQAIWQYGFSTMGVFRDGKKSMAGYGFGIPLSRLYTRYWGGELDIKFMEGYGTDTYITLPLLGNQKESEEMLNNCLYYN